ncbi:MAG: hypothetical protein H7061_14075 [Bdellovibrionaceae bacterium]|nr:hypothetical protein [Bdellovibrio sp.]
MNFILQAALLSLLALPVQAEEVGIKINDVNTTQDTTISIKKGDAGGKRKYTLSNGEEDISGDKNVVMKDAEKSWKSACLDWKKEFRELNKDNKIITMNCGQMKCTKDGVESICSSTAKHKVKVLLEE